MSLIFTYYLPQPMFFLSLSGLKLLFNIRLFQAEVSFLLFCVCVWSRHATHVFSEFVYLRMSYFNHLLYFSKLRLPDVEFLVDSLLFQHLKYAIPLPSDQPDP